MKISDIMTTNVVTIPSSTSIADARRIMEAHHISRLPVVDKGKLTGIVTVHQLESVSPSKATSLTVWEVGYLLEKTPVKDVMEKEVITVTPDMTAEKAVSLAQSHKVGSVVVVEDGRVVGMVTTDDIFYKIVNPVLGLNEAGSRVCIRGGANSKALEEIMSIMNRLGMKLVTLHIEQQPETAERDVCVHIDKQDPKQLLSELKSKGYLTEERAR